MNVYLYMVLNHKFSTSVNRKLKSSFSIFTEVQPQIISVSIPGIVKKRMPQFLHSFIYVGLVTLNWTVFKRTVTIENQEKR